MRVMLHEPILQRLDDAIAAARPRAILEIQLTEQEHDEYMAAMQGRDPALYRGVLVVRV